MPFIPCNANSNTHFTMCVLCTFRNMTWSDSFIFRIFHFIFHLKSQALFALHISYFVRVLYVSFMHAYFHVYSIRLTVSNSIRVFFLFFCDAKMHWMIWCPENTKTNLRRQEISRANNTRIPNKIYVQCTTGLRTKINTSQNFISRCSNKFFLVALVLHICEFSIYSRIFTRSRNSHHEYL